MRTKIHMMTTGKLLKKYCLLFIAGATIQLKTSAFDVELIEQNGFYPPNKMQNPNLWQHIYYIQLGRNYKTLKHFFMRSILYLIAIILVVGWLLGVFVYSAGGLIHILLVIAVVALLLGLIRRA